MIPFSLPTTGVSLTLVSGALASVSILLISLRSFIAERIFCKLCTLFGQDLEQHIISFC